MGNTKPTLPTTEKGFFSNVGSYIKKPFKSIFKQFKDVLMPILSVRGWLVMVASTVILKLTSMERVKEFITTLWSKPADAIANKINPNHKDKADKRAIIKALVSVGYDKKDLANWSIETLQAEKAKLSPEGQQALQDAAKIKGQVNTTKLEGELKMLNDRLITMAAADINQKEVSILDLTPEGEELSPNLSAAQMLGGSQKDYEQQLGKFVVSPRRDPTSQLFRNIDDAGSKAEVADAGSKAVKPETEVADAATTSAPFSGQAGTTT